MNWQEAKQQTLETWLELRESLGRAHPVDLLSEINLICPLCTKALEERAAAGEESDALKCDFCPGYEQFGGCKEVCSELSLKVAENEWEAARAIADEFIAKLRALRLPEEARKQ